MSVAARISPKDYFTAEEWATLTPRSSWKGLALVAHCWAMIFAAGAMAVIWPITIPLAIMIIGARQLGLGILMHDAAHGALHPNLKASGCAARRWSAIANTTWPITSSPSSPRTRTWCCRRRFRSPGRRCGAR